MLNNQTLERLRALKLSGMADAYQRHLEQPATHDLSFDDRFALLVDAETTARANKRLTRLLQLARLRHHACVEDIDYTHPRGLHRQQVAQLISGAWLRTHQYLHITGPTGIGKSWLAAAFGNLACRHGMSVRCERVSRLTDELRIARGDGSYGKRLVQLAKTELLILDDFGLKPLTAAEKHDLLEVIEDRHGRRATLVTSQLPVSRWHEYLSDPTLADAMVDRLLENAHRLELTGESLRRRQAAARLTAKKGTE